MSEYDKRREQMRDQTTAGKHIFLTGSNALETLDDALGALVSRERQIARSEGFEACTKYWKNVVREILKEEHDDSIAVLRIMKAFNLDLDLDLDKEEEKKDDYQIEYDYDDKEPVHDCLCRGANACFQCNPKLFI
jgi:hypothetical protein